MHHLNRSLTAVVLLYTVFIFSRAFAATIFVDDSAAPGGDGTAGAPFQAIQEGVDAATPGADTVSVAPGVYFGDPANSRDVGNFGPTLAVVHMVDGVDVVASDPNPSQTIIDAQGNSPAVVFDGIASATITGFHIRNGGSTYYGAGILSVASDATITSNLITANNSDDSGGGIWVGYGGVPTISYNTISGNYAAFEGGGISISDSYYARIDNNNITSNVAGYNYGTGGGVYLYYAEAALQGNYIVGNDVGYGRAGGIGAAYSGATLDTNIIESNTAGIGGGMATYLSTSTMTGNTFRYNTVNTQYSSYRGGGAVYVRFSAASFAGDTISYNNAYGQSYATALGGGIDALASTIQLTNVTMEGNQADGGGALALALYSAATLTNAQIRSNAATTNGGGIFANSYYGDGYYGQSQVLEVNGGTIDGNQAAYSGGGISFTGNAAYDYGSGSLTINGTTISGNQAGDGGGGVLSENNLETITGALFFGNTAGVNGGGILSARSVQQITSSYFIGNSSTSGNGGGLYLVLDKSTITGTTISTNFAGSDGGGIQVSGGCVTCADESSAFVTIGSSLISGNTSYGVGGGIRGLTLSYAAFTNNTIVGNQSPSGPGGGIYIASTDSWFLSNSIIEGNTASSGGGVYAGNPYTTPPTNYPEFLNNDLFGNTPDNWAGGSVYSPSDPTGTNGNISADPLFTSPGGDYSLASGSPAIDTGNPAAKGLSGPDAVGAPRVVDGDLSGSAVVDMGAFEAPFLSVNTPPVAITRARLAFRDGDTIVLDGTRSFDPDGDLLTFDWNQVGGPPANLDSDSAPSPTILSLGTPAVPINGPWGYAALPTTILFDLTVSDGKSSGTDRLEVRLHGSGTATSLDVAGFRFTYEFGSSQVPLGVEITQDGSELLLIAQRFFNADDLVHRAPLIRDGATGRIVDIGAAVPDTNLQVIQANTLALHPSGTLFVTNRNLGLTEIPPGGTPVEFDLAGIFTPGGIAFVPTSLPWSSAGDLLIGDTSTNLVLTVPLTDNGDGTYTPGTAVLFVDLTGIAPNPQGLAFMDDATGSQDLLVSSRSNGELWQVFLEDLTGLPFGGAAAFTPSQFTAYAPAARDPLTDDILVVNEGTAYPGAALVTFRPVPQDFDSDTVPDDQDNCPTIPNPLQEDTGGEPGVGDACDNVAQITTADLAVTKVESVDPVPPASALAYTIVVTNNGPDAADNVVVTDTLPADVTFLSTNGGCAENPNGVPTCTLGTIGPGATAQYAITVVVDSLATGTLTNTATVTSSATDPNSGNNTATAVTTVTPVGPASADLSISKSGSPDPVLAGGAFTYTVTVDNLGPDNAQSVVVTDTLELGTGGQPILTGATTSGCAEDPGGVPTCTLGTLGPQGASFTISGTVSPAATGSMSNTASVTSSTNDPNNANNSTTIVTEIDDRPTADAGADTRGTTGSTLVLDGSGSSDPEGQPLTYRWRQVSGGTFVPMATPTSVTTSIDVSQVTPTDLLTFALDVDDGASGVVTDFVNVQIVPFPEWHRWRHDSTNSGVTPSQGPSVLGSNLSVTFPGAVRSSVSFDTNDGMYVGNDDGNLYALNLDGTVRWAFPTGGSVRTTPMLANGRVYFGSMDGSLYAVDQSTGVQAWSYDGGAGAMFRFSSPLLVPDFPSGTLVIAGTSEGLVVALDDSNNGAERWRFQAGGAVHSSLASYGGNQPLVVFGSTDGFVRALDLSNNGALVWETGFGIPVQSGISVDPQNGLAYFGTDAGQVVAVQVDTGQVVWTFQASGAVTSSPAVDAARGQVIVGSDDFNVYALNGLTGAEVWRSPTDSYVRSSPTVDSGTTVYVASCDGDMYAMSAVDGSPLGRFDLSSGVIVASPTVGTDGLVYLGSTNTFLYLIGPDPFAGGQEVMAPRLDALTPSTLMQGETAEISVRGRDLTEGVDLDLGPGIVVESTELVSPTEIMARVRLADGAPLGVRDVQTRRDEGLPSSRLGGLEVTFDCRRADMTGDGTVDGLDLVALAGRFGSETEGRTAVDLDGDGRVDGADLALLAARFGRARDTCR